MILHGNQRGGGRDLALHLMKDENERVDVHELRGFVADGLVGAFKESHAISKATRCKQHLYSLSINPPKDAAISDADFVAAIDRTEEKLGLSGQPRAIVFHEKRGHDGILRRHAHAVWCRIDTEKMKAVQLSHSKLKLRDVSRDLHIQHGLKMPPGLVNSKDRDPRNFSLEQWQQCKRAKKSVHDVKDTFKDCWAISDSKTSFSHALAERGYVLAQGRRGHVAVDHEGEKYAVSRYVDITARQVRAKLGEADRLPTVERAQEQAAKQIADRLAQLRMREAAKAAYAQEQAITRDRRMQAAQDVQKARLDEQHASRQQIEEQARQARIRTGLTGFFDRFTGRRKRMMQKNASDALAKQHRDECERRALEQKLRREIQLQRDQANSLRSKHVTAVRELDGDIERLRTPPEPKPGFEKAAYVAKEKARNRRPRHTRSRDGPKFER